MYAIVLSLFIATLVAAVNVSAQTRRTTVYFRVGKSDIDTTAFNNVMALDSLRLLSAAIAVDSTTSVTGIHYEGYASPEGPASVNRRLARERRRALEEYVCRYFPGLDSVSTRSEAVYDSVVVLEYAGATDAARMNMLRHFGPLRRASVLVEYQQICSAEEAVEADTAADSVCVVYADTVAPPEAAEAADSATADVAENHRPLYIGIKTNMLYDAALIPTLGAEVYVGRNFSISGQWSYSWWSRDVKHRYWRYYGGDLEVRRWFGRQSVNKPLTGHHVGIYVQLFTYDFENGGKGQMGAKFNYGGGFEYGFSLPVSRRLNIDFSIGAGFIFGRYHKYTPVDGHYVWQSTHNRRWFGPAKAEISLVWLVGRGNYNAGKGGRR